MLVLNAKNRSDNAELFKQITHTENEIKWMEKRTENRSVETFKSKQTSRKKNQFDALICEFIGT